MIIVYDWNNDVRDGDDGRGRGVNLCPCSFNLFSFISHVAKPPQRSKYRSVMVRINGMNIVEHPFPLFLI